MSYSLQLNAVVTVLVPKNHVMRQSQSQSEFQQQATASGTLHVPITFGPAKVASVGSLPPGRPYCWHETVEVRGDRGVNGESITSEHIVYKLLSGGRQDLGVLMMSLLIALHTSDEASIS
jgi:hypothetical protein